MSPALDGNVVGASLQKPTKMLKLLQKLKPMKHQRVHHPRINRPVMLRLRPLILHLHAVFSVLIRAIFRFLLQGVPVAAVFYVEEVGLIPILIANPVGDEVAAIVDFALLVDDSLAQVVVLGDAF